MYSSETDTTKFARHFYFKLQAKMENEAIKKKCTLCKEEKELVKKVLGVETDVIYYRI